MHAEIMSIGDELTSGQRLDTNTQWLSQRLGECGIPVRFHSTVADELEDLVQAFQIASQRAPLVLVTGGLGPTADDLTRDALAAAAGCELELRPDVLEHIERLFAGRSRTMPERNRVQAMFPRGSVVIPNPHGTAPGIDLAIQSSIGTSRVFALPGVPAEMIEMWEASVQPAIMAMMPQPRILRHHRVKCFGVGESHLESLLPDLIRRDREPRVGITVHQATITLRITAAGKDDAECREAMEPTIRTIRDCLGPLVFGEEDDELEHAVIGQLRVTRGTLAVCEWATGGLVTHWLRKVDSETEPLVRGGLVVSNRSQLASWFSDKSLPDVERMPVEELVSWIAQQTRRIAGSDWGLAIGPTPAVDEADPQLTIALANATEIKIVQHNYAAHPDVVVSRAAKQALDLVRRSTHG